MQFEQFVTQFTESINIIDFLIGAAVAAPLLIVLRLFYIRYGNAVSNRTRFASNFLPLGLTTMLIITIVKSSIALSLGLVGALSIVRFRAAIKDPEELTYLFLCIAVGLACGANEPWIALIGFVVILGLVLLNNRLSDNRSVKKQDSMYLNIQTDLTSVKQISDTISPSFSFVELKRMDQTPKGLDLSYIVKTDAVENIDTVKEALQKLSPNTTLSLVDQPDLGL